MRTRNVLFTALMASAVLVWCVGSSLRAQDVKAAPFSGSWHFNPDLSSDVSEMPSQSEVPGGGSYGGRPGGFGGRGGRGGFGGGGSSSSGMSSRDLAQLEGLRSEVMRHTDRLDIVEHDADLTLTSSDGIVRKFAINGKDEDISIGSTSTRSRTTRDGTSIVQELEAGPLKIRRTFQTALNGQLLVVSVTAENRSSGRQGGIVVPFKFIYQRPADSTVR